MVMTLVTQKKGTPGTVTAGVKNGTGGLALLGQPAIATRMTSPLEAHSLPAMGIRAIMKGN